MDSSVAPRTSSLRMILVGRTGTGKSSSGNTILGRNVFDSSAELASATDACTQKKAVIRGTLVEVMDTPGLFDTAQTHEETGVVIVQAFVNMHPGPDLFVYVIKLGTRYTDEEYKSYRRFKMLFGKKVTKHLVILFTGLDEIEEKGRTIEQVLGNAPADLLKVLEDCNGRYVVFNNKAKPTEGLINPHVEKLLQTAEALMQANMKQPYTCNQYSKIGETLDEAVSKKLREIEDEEAKALRRTQQLEEELREKVEEMDLSKTEYEREMTYMKKKLKDEYDHLLEDWEQKKEAEEEEIRARQEEHEKTLRQERQREEQERKSRLEKEEQERKLRQEQVLEEQKRKLKEERENEERERKSRLEKEEQERKLRQEQVLEEQKRKLKEERENEERERKRRLDEEELERKRRIEREEQDRIERKLQQQREYEEQQRQFREDREREQRERQRRLEQEEEEKRERKEMEERQRRRAEEERQQAQRAQELWSLVTTAGRAAVTVLGASLLTADDSEDDD